MMYKNVYFNFTLENGEQDGHGMKSPHDAEKLRPPNHRRRSRNHTVLDAELRRKDLSQPRPICEHQTYKFARSP